MIRQKIRKKPLLKKLGDMPPTTLEDQIIKHRFPKPHQIIPGGRAVAWYEDEVEAALAGLWRPGWKPQQHSQEAA